ncbi:MAG: hypothetical protein JNM76_15540 [Betaproteobacteria bacterium]|nr:hypothetical protein [Betaproteobacteria bacterium]
MSRRRNPAGCAITEDAHARVKRHLVQRLYVRFHMTLILGTSVFAAMLASWAMLQLGVDSMWVRYAIAVLGAYAAFLLGVGLWLRYVARVRRDRADPALSAQLDGGDPVDALDLINSVGDLGSGVARGGGRISSGGDFGGGGASGSWTEPGVQQGFVSGAESSAASAGKGFDFNFDLDGDGLVVLVLAIAVIAAVVFASGYIVWFAPDILAEAVVGAALAGSLAKTARREDGSGWVMGVVKKTWWLFAIVLVLSVGFAFHAQSVYPGVKTAKEVVARALASADSAPAPDKP